MVTIKITVFASLPENVELCSSNMVTIKAKILRFKAFYKKIKEFSMFFN